MDAFAVSLVRGAVGKRRLLPAIEVGVVFGVAQGLMPLLGWSLGRAFQGTFQSIDHWIAFVLLAGLGGRMLVGSLEADEPKPPAHTHLLGLVTAAVATSIDAAAAGLTFDLLGVALPVACLTIAATTAVLCTAGYLIGSQIPGRAGKYAEALGGLILIGLGVKILVEHLAH